MSLLLNLGLAAGLLGSAADSSVGAPPEAPTTAKADLTEQAMAALGMFERGDFIGAATAFEQLWEQTQDPRYAFNAGVARERLGEETRAYVLFRQALAVPTIEEEERSAVERRLGELKARTAKLQLEVTMAPPAGPTPRFTLTREGAAAPLIIDAALFADDRGGENAKATYTLHIEPGVWTIVTDAEEHSSVSSTIEARATGTLLVPIDLDAATFEVDVVLSPSIAVERGVAVRIVDISRDETVISEVVSRPHRQWALSPGNFRLSAEADGYTPLEREFAVPGDAYPLRLTLSAQSGGEAPGGPHERGKLDREAKITAAVFGGIAGASLLSGAIVAGRSAANYTALRDPYLELAQVDPQTAAGRMELYNRNLYGAVFGSTLLGVGVGSGSAALSAFARDQRRASIVQLTSGGLFAVAGLALFGAGAVSTVREAEQNVEFFGTYEDEEGPEFASTPASMLRNRALQSTGMFAAGAALGLVAGGITSMLRARKAPKARREVTTTMMFSPLGGLLLRGRF